MRIDRLLVKPVPVAVKMMPDAEMEPLYDGANKMIIDFLEIVVLRFSTKLEKAQTTRV